MRDSVHSLSPRVGLVVAGLTLAACGPTVRPEIVPTPPPRPVLSEEEVLPVAELIMLEDRREFDARRLERLARHPSAEVRRRTALALGRLRRVEGLSLLSSLLSDADTAVAATAAFGIGLVGDTTAVPGLAELIRDPAFAGSSPAAEAAAALGRLHSATASASLLSLLAETSLQQVGDPVIQEALLAVWRHPREPDATPLLRWTAAEDPELRWRAAYALTRRPDPAATPTLLRLAADPDARVRAHAVRGLTGPLADSAGVPRASVEEVLLRILDDADYSTRINAIRSLGTLDTPTVVARLEGLLGSDPPDAVAAAESLGRIGSAASRSALRLAPIVADPGAPVGLRIAALAALLPLHPAAAEETAERLAGDPSWRMRAAAGRTLAQLGPVDRPLLRALVRDADVRVAASTLQAAAENAQLAQHPLRLLLVEALGSSDIGVRTAALRGLARLRDPSTLPVLVDAYGAALGDPSNAAALAALDALAALHQAGAPAANTLFRRFSRPEDYLLRLRAENLFGELARAAWDDPLPIETNRTLEGYVGLVQRFVLASALGEPPPHALLVTDAGEIEIELFAPDAPLTVENFLRLAAAGYFDGQEWPRVVPNFVIQGGDPRGDQTGGPGYVIRDEINRHRYGAGTVGMALSGPDTGGSQFFVTHAPQPHLDGGYTVFGRLVSPADVVEQVGVGDRIHSLREIATATRESSMAPASSRESTSLEK